MNDVLCVPEWNQDSFNVLKYFYIYKNGAVLLNHYNNRKLKYSTYRELYGHLLSSYHNPNQLRRAKLYVDSLFRKFMYRDVEGIMDKILRLQYDDSKIKKFVTSKQERIDLDVRKLSDKKVKEFYCIVVYWEVCESLISYLEQAHSGQKFLIGRLKNMFTKNDFEFSEYLDKKTEFLMGLNLDNHIADMNKETEKKRREKIESMGW